MAHESFESQDVAEVLNKYFVSVKVDKEERPDVDSIYMSVCQILTGSGGWPLTIIMTPDQVPFYAGTYLPKHSRRGMPGIIELLLAVTEQWDNGREGLLSAGKRIVAALNHTAAAKNPGSFETLPQDALNMLKRQFDSEYGGFGSAPKFPSAHNLLFLMTAYEQAGDSKALEMAEKTLLQMYLGGMFDHIGYGFSRYSTDRYWLVPHFEKMLYDNALLVLAYTKAYELTGKHLYKYVAESTLLYVERELSNPSGGFCSAQDADSDGIEGKYYVFTPDEVASVLGESRGRRFCGYFGITGLGNFEGKSIPNRINGGDVIDPEIQALSAEIYEYRKKRCALGTDDKVLTSWNGLMIAAFARAYSVFKDERYLNIAVSAVDFIKERLWDGERLYAAYRGGRRTKDGYLDDYAFLTYALLELYESARKSEHLEFARTLINKTLDNFWDDGGGFFIYSSQSERLIHRPKETYDGAMPSGNSVMLHNLQKIPDGFEKYAEKQEEFMAASAHYHPSGFCFAMTSFYPKRAVIRCEGGVCTVE